jgi:Na+:H+ antiporter, NhaA family
MRSGSQSVCGSAPIRINRAVASTVSVAPDVWSLRIRPVRWPSPWVTVFTWAATRIGITRLPDGVRWSHLVGVAALAGIGFTVALFITNLAFERRELQDAAKVGILAASLLAGLLGALLLARSQRR